MHRGLITGPRDLGVRGEDLDRLIGRQRDYFAARGEAVEWKTRGHDLPADLPGRLRSAGFVPEDQETVLIGRAEEMATTRPRLPVGVALRHTAAEADMHRIAAMESQVWGQDWSWLADDLIGRLATAPDDIAVIVAEADGQVVSAGGLVFRPGTDFASLWGGSTLRAWRGQGIYRSLVAHRASGTRGTTAPPSCAASDATP